MSRDQRGKHVGAHKKCKTILNWKYNNAVKTMHKEFFSWKLMF